MCQQCHDYLEKVMSLNHDMSAICGLINSEPWYHKTHGGRLTNIKSQGLRLGRYVGGIYNSCYGDGISLCKEGCWSSRISGDKLLQIQLNVLNPLYDVYSQTAFNNKYSTPRRFYQNSFIVGAYLGGSSKNLEANIKRTDALLDDGFDAVLFEEHEHAVLVYLRNIPHTNVEYIGL